MRKPIKKTPFQITGICNTINVVTPMSYDEQQGKYFEDKNGRYEVQLLVKKDNPLAPKLLEVMQTESNKFKAEMGKAIPIGGNMQVHCCVRDGDIEEQFKKYNSVFADSYVIGIKSKFRPTLLDIQGGQINIGDETEVNKHLYRGVTAKVAFEFYQLTDTNKKIGLFANLRGLRVVAYTEPLNNFEELDPALLELTEEEEEYFKDMDF
jgi:hypothetical protein